MGRIGIALNEVSTWRGILLIANGFGYVVAPELQDGFIALALFSVGALDAFIRRSQK